MKMVFSIPAHSLKTIQKVPVFLDKALDYFLNLPPTFRLLLDIILPLKLFQSTIGMLCMPGKSLNIG